MARYPSSIANIIAQLLHKSGEEQVDDPEVIGDLVLTIHEGLRESFGKKIITEGTVPGEDVYHEMISRTLHGDDVEEGDEPFRNQELIDRHEKFLDQILVAHSLADLSSIFERYTHFLSNEVQLAPAELEFWITEAIVPDLGIERDQVMIPVRESDGKPTEMMNMDAYHDWLSRWELSRMPRSEGRESTRHL